MFSHSNRWTPYHLMHIDQINQNVRRRSMVSHHARLVPERIIYIHNCCCGRFHFVLSLKSFLAAFVFVTAIMNINNYSLLYIFAFVGNKKTASFDSYWTHFVIASFQFHATLRVRPYSIDH